MFLLAVGDYSESPCDMHSLLRRHTYYVNVTGNYILNSCRLSISVAWFYLHPHSVQCSKI